MQEIKTRQNFVYFIKGIDKIPGETLAKSNKTISADLIVDVSLTDARIHITTG